MPIYEYSCTACGHHLEALQKMSDSPLRKCPACGKSRLRRLISASRFRLKGSGWYETDFKDDGAKKRNLLDAASEPAATSSSDDTKAAPAESKAADSGAGSNTKPAADNPKPASAKSSSPRKKSRSAPKAVKSARR